MGRVGTTACIGNMRSPAGTTIVDASDPKNLREISRLGAVTGTHSHKVAGLNIREHA